LDLHENFIIDVSLDKEVYVDYWKSSGYGLRIPTGFAFAEVCTFRVLLLKTICQAFAAASQWWICC